MPKPDETHVFPSPLLPEPGTMRLSAILVPLEIDDLLQAAGVKAVVGEISSMTEGVGEAVPFRRMVHGRGDGMPYLRFGKAIVARAGLEDGATALVEIWPDPDPSTAILPPELIAALAGDPEAAARFYAFTAGRQRSLATHVTSAKRAETRVRRAEEIVYKTRTFTLYGDK